MARQAPGTVLPAVSLDRRHRVLWKRSVGFTRCKTGRFHHGALRTWRAGPPPRGGPTGHGPPRFETTVLRRVRDWQILEARLVGLAPRPPLNAALNASGGHSYYDSEGERINGSTNDAAPQKGARNGGQNRRGRRAECRASDAGREARKRPESFLGLLPANGSRFLQTPSAPSSGAVRDA
jgi:hypothetical protein